MSGTSYSKHPFNPLLSSSHLKEFTVLDVQLDHPSQRTNREITEESNIVMGDVEVIRSDDFGVSNDTIIVRSHLCGVLEPGMLVMGYDLRRSALNNDEYEKYSDLLPDVVLVCRAKDPERKQQQKKNKKKERLREVSTASEERNREIEQYEEEREQYFLEEVSENGEENENGEVSENGEENENGEEGVLGEENENGEETKENGM